MKYVYPAIFTPVNGGYSVYIPDLPHCRTFGKSLAEAIEMAEDAASMWLWDAENEKEAIPQASESLPHTVPEFISMIVADTTAYRRQAENRAIKKTLTIPAWLNQQAEAAHVNFSSVLQDALKSHLKIAQ
ncbi:MAG: type II toxin-antitoxin system HicB family antitoxin [Defluviitaleaceae bacterium]|nr:type II toxin-antitoxin system HicB family antitoxin [Defluviitaleaceae bacterium]